MACYWRPLGELKDGEIRFLSSFLAVTEVNTYLAMHYFVPLRNNFGGFYKNLAFKLVLN